ncbi:hypothetical protein QBC42DRAFT_301056 [Cladorrhinum samala]|uniref:Extracellular membrane protein CFEM domain-containing protein n=1 Tax=Cladorrhinum samala TaxID=585594 RepID=A0AAV9HDG5_9PEZI|nr:hypothetical protein QBC42DRAFT_301056 [Cladorrhinum samala]
MLQSTFLTFLSVLPFMAAAQHHPMITPAAAVRARATDGTGVGSDCDASLVPWMSCAGSGLSSDLCLGTAATLNVQSSCACSQATSLYDCYTKYCSPGTEFPAYYTAVSYCASKGYGKAPPKPTGAAASALGDSGSGSGSGSGNGGSGGGDNKSGASGMGAGDMVLWSVWGVVGLGMGVGMLV